MDNYMAQLFAGLLNNLLITLLSAIIPLGVGIGLTILMKAVNKKGVRIPLRIIGGVFYSLAPLALLMFICFYVMPTARQSAMPILLTLTISHLGFMAMAFDENASVLKNIVVNLLGLLSSLFMWSMIASYIGYRDIVSASTTIRGATFDASCTIATLLITFAVLAVLNVIRMILKETMK